MIDDSRFTSDVTDKGSDLDKRHSRITVNLICRMSSPDPLSV